MALTKVLTGGLALDAVDNTILKLDDDYALTGTVTGTVAGTAAFAARFDSDGWVAIADGTIIPFNNDSAGDSFDTDGVFNTSTYKFTAPATGVYMFWYAMYTADSEGTEGFAFLKNSSKVNFQNGGAKYITFLQATTNDNMQNGTIIITLASGNTMAVCTSIASSYYTGHCQWGGCRLA